MRIALRARIGGGTPRKNARVRVLDGARLECVDSVGRTRDKDMLDLTYLGWLYDHTTIDVDGGGILTSLQGSSFTCLDVPAM